MRRIIIGIIACGLAAGTAAAQSAWLPEQGRFVSSGALVHQTFDQFYRGDTRSPTPFGDLAQTSLTVGVERALGSDLALDGTIGMTSTSGTAASGLGESGMTDTTIGLRWRALDEFARDGAPTVTLRIGGIVEGTYDIGNPAAPGDGASGVVGSVIVGKTFGASGFGMHGDAGYRVMGEDVPDAIFGSVQAFRSFGRHSVSTGYRYDGCLTGIDIGSPGFTPDRFPETKEIVHAVELGWSFSTASRGTWSMALGRTIDGRNTDRKTAVVATVTY